MLYRFVKNSNSKNFYRLIGLRRSGNHALVNWLRPMLPGFTLFLNNQQLQLPESVEIKKYSYRWGRGVNLLVSHEDQDLDFLLEKYRKPWYGESAKKINLLLLRDPYNWLASWYAWQDEPGHRFRTDADYRQQLIQQYLHYAEEFQRWSEQEVVLDGIRCLPVNFNSFTEDLSYRQTLAHTLSLQFSDKGRNKLTPEGLGSSFDGLQYKGKASQMAVNQRYERFLDDPFFQALFSDQLHAVAEEVFSLNNPFVI